MSKLIKYSYAIIKHNYPGLQQETVLLENKYKPASKYALINKVVHKDGSESIASIQYSNDLEKMQSKVKGLKSWYNYPIGIAKSMQGYLMNI